MKPIYNALIIGAGKIGSFFDRPDSKSILTHAHAFTKHPHFNLIGFVDQDLVQAKKAAEHWNSKAFSTIEEAMSTNDIDVISICTPDSTHFELIKTCDTFNIKLIFAEKPLAKTLAEADAIVQQVKTPILVNYSRRFVNEFFQAKKLHENKLGKFKTGTGYYGKGFLHNGSHMLDFLRFFIGEIKKLTIAKTIEEYYPDDLNADALIEFNNGGTFNMLSTDSRNYTIFEMDLLFEKGRVRILNSGFDIEIYETKEDSLYQGYYNLSLISKITTSLDRSIYSAAENIFQFLSNQSPLKCTVHDGYEVIKLGSEIHHHDN